MLARIILLIAQLAVGWSLGHQVRGLVPLSIGQLDIFLFALIVAVLVWLTGHIGALVLKDTLPPSTSTLTACVVLALAGAALALVPPVTQAMGALLKGGVPLRAYPLVGVVIGYLLRR